MKQVMSYNGVVQLDESGGHWICGLVSVYFSYSYGCHVNGLNDHDDTLIFKLNNWALIATNTMRINLSCKRKRILKDHYVTTSSHAYSFATLHYILHHFTHSIILCAQTSL